ncbi:hypothetical protein [uncultured Erythrobacter sp.]|uniref:hypothetical protein n=1 Tax=uncultured Erythrobacter sp. TaxID=263913 RepID=UPI002626003A|nr:hypothetical protein [uncultured Erythrobacter sp.]
MADQPSENLPAEVQLALAHTRPNLRDALRIFFELDMRLGRIVAATNEPMLGQMRLAWWRDMLGTSVEDRPSGDAVLDGIGEHWAEREAELVPLVDAWEHLLAEPPLSDADAIGFAENRGQALLAIYGDKEGKDAAWHWAVADLASKVSLDEERTMLVKLGLQGGASRSLPRQARGLAVLGALGQRALKRGGRPLMEGRTASLVALRAASFGR